MQPMPLQNPWRPTSQDLEELLDILDDDESFDPFDSVNPFSLPASEAEKRRKIPRPSRSICIAIGTAALVIVLGMMPGLLGVQLRVVLTGSMEPDLPVGSLVVAIPTSLEKIQEGDDIIYVANEGQMVITHRVVAVDEIGGMLTTKGIANEYADSPMRYENVLGVVKLKIPYIGYPMIWIKGEGSA